MITVKYRLIGDVNNAELTKEFNTEGAYNDFVRSNKNIIILEVERTGAAAMARIYGG